MLTRFVAVVAVVLSAVSPAFAQGAVEKARLSRTMWSAFQCATFAEMSGNPTEQARLFDVGVKSGREFLEAVKNRQIPPDIANQEVPIGVSMLLRGPSTDFVVGRIFEAAMSDAFDDIIKKENGLMLDSSKWANDEGLKKSKAQSQYQRSNCVLVK